MKVFKKLKKIFCGLSIIGLSFFSKIYAALNTDNMKLIALYGVPKRNTGFIVLKNILNVFRVFVIPLILLIGIIIYIKKSRASKTKKIITVICFIILAILLFFIISSIVYYIENNKI